MIGERCSWYIAWLIPDNEKCRFPPPPNESEYIHSANVFSRLEPQVNNDLEYK